jgi:phosphohistidine phosphatase SixA
MLKMIASTANNISTLAIIGHNPTFTELGHYYGKHFAKSISKCGVLALQFNVNDWQSIKPYTGESLFYISPKTL